MEHIRRELLHKLENIHSKINWVNVDNMQIVTLQSNYIFKDDVYHLSVECFVYVDEQMRSRIITEVEIQSIIFFVNYDEMPRFTFTKKELNNHIKNTIYAKKL